MCEQHGSNIKSKIESVFCSFTKNATSANGEVFKIERQVFHMANEMNCTQSPRRLKLT